MAQKIHPALQSVSVDSGDKFIGSVKDSTLKKFQESISKANLEVSEDSSPARKSDSRCTFLAFLTLESNGTWRIVTAPLHCLDPINLASGVNMDGLQLVLPPPIRAFKVKRRKDQRGCPPEKAFPVSTYTGRNITGSYVRRQPPYRSRLSTLKERSGQSSSQSLATCNNLSHLNLDSITPGDRSDTFLDSPKIDTTVKKSSKRKTKKKSQQSKKFYSDAGSTGPENLPQDYGHWCSISGACRNNDVDNRDGLVSCSTESGQLACEDKLHQEYEVHKASEIVNISEAQSSVSSYTDKDALVFDSIPIGSKSNRSNSDQYERLSQKPSSSGNIAVPYGLDARGDPIMCQTSIHGSGNPCDCPEVRHTIQGCRDGEKGKQNKLVYKNSNKFEFSGNLHGHVGKENNHSVWQKVRRSELEECDSEVKKASSTMSQTDISSRKVASHNGNCNLVVVNGKAEQKKQAKHKVGRKLKRKNNAAPKQESSCCSIKGSHSDRAIIDEHGKISKHQAANTYSSPENDQRYNTLSRSYAHVDSQRDECHITKAESKNTESVERQQIYPNDLLPVKNDKSGSIIENQENVKNEENLFLKSCDHSSQSNFSGEKPMHLSYGLADGPGDMQKKSALIDCNKLSHSSSSTMQKWIPIRVKDSESSTSIHSERSAEFSAENSTLVNSHGGESDEESVSSFNIKATQLGQTSGNSTDLLRRNQARSSCLTCEDNHHDRYDIDSTRIAQAVSEACKMQLASEAIHMVSRGPVAEFERLLHVFSPVICHSPDLVKCFICADSNTVCRHEVSNLSLGNMWQWYEKHGSCGLEIRCQNYENPKRLGADRFSFLAYFVPYLSAVQLFRYSSNQPVHSSSKAPDSEDLGGSRVVNNSASSSNDCQNPIFSILFPRPCSQDQSNPVPADQMSCSEESPSSCKDSSSIPLVETTRSDELELLFEYFESQPPQQRRPLYDKILQLITGHGISESRMYGDPTNLESTKMQDLHPASWYSVAWYPIYRIPDSSFRAAFLTYHSFGHLVHRNNNMDFQDIDACVVSPVVGLQSYNAQRECWFQLRQSALSETVRTSGLNPSEILKERLRTLEETASLMSKAVVNKGNLMSTNKHHDYEFFSSRRC